MLGNRQSDVCDKTEEACLSQSDLSNFLFDVLYLLNTFSRNSRERHPEAQMSSNSVSVHLKYIVRFVLILVDPLIHSQDFHMNSSVCHTFLILLVLIIWCSKNNLLNMRLIDICPYHSMHLLLPFHWPRAHHVTCK